MTLETPICSDHPVPTPLQFGSALDRPIDDLNDWPDLRQRDLTVDELAALRRKIAQVVEVVEELDGRLEREESARREDPAWPQRADRPHYVPGTIVSYIRISLKLAQEMLDERRGDEVAVSHLRLSEALARLLVTWRGEAGEGLINALFTDVRSPEPLVEVPRETVHRLPRFFVLEPAEHGA